MASSKFNREHRKTWQEILVAVGDLKPPTRRSSKRIKMDASRTDFYVYSLVDPRNSDTFYIGKGTKNRGQQHVADVLAGKSRNVRKTHRIEDILASGLEPVVCVLHAGLTNEAAVCLERKLIVEHRSHITNIAPGRMTETEVNLHRAKRMYSNLATKREWILMMARRNGCAPTAEQWKFYQETSRMIKVNYSLCIADYRALTARRGKHAST